MESHCGLALHSDTIAVTDACEQQSGLEAQVRSLQQLVAELLLSNERLRQALADGDGEYA
jgi:hypothetical protein